MKAYLHGIGNVSPQHTTAPAFWENPVECQTHLFWCAEPAYKDYIQSNLVRRMSRIVRMSLAASEIALREAGIEHTDAILTGTCMGCTQDSIKFLTAMIENGEQMLTPTAFVQSTHNTVGGQIALLRQNTCYNMTYVHRGFSFESALLDGLLQLEEGEARSVLVGGAEELTDRHEFFLGALKCLKETPLSSSEQLDQHRRILAGEAVEQSNGAMFGEGAAFFVLSQEPAANEYGYLAGLKMIYKPQSKTALLSDIQQFLTEIGWSLSEVDLVLLGNSGDARSDGYYHFLQQQLFADKAIAYFKHLCGEYATASSFALWLAAQIMQQQAVPAIVRGNEKPLSSIRKILIYNNSQGEYHSLMACAK